MKSTTLSLFFALLFFHGSAQQKQPVLKTDSALISYRVGSVYHKNWAVSPQVRPDILDVLVKDKPVKVSFISATDSIAFHVEGGKLYDFVVLQDGKKDTAYTRIKGIRYVKPANFTEAYKQQNRGKTLVEIKPVYELVNILYALTPTGKKNDNTVYRKSAYYREVQDWFAPFASEKIVAQMDTALKNEQYPILKMDAYAFEMAGNRITQSKIYDRVSWRDTNTLRPYIADMENFAKKSRFADFYRKHKAFYDAQERCYRDSINTGQMVGWLRKHFPTTTYDAFKIIFSPLVSWNQSANWFSDNGFEEAHAHVNFPYVTSESKKKWTGKGLIFLRGDIVFTEINHSFINPESDKYVADPAFKKAFLKLDNWIDREKPAANYDNAYSCFNEYMNWALVSLYAADYAPKAEFQKMTESIGESIQEGRGFKKFKTFNAFLIYLYKNRPPGKTLADLYPQIISWFASNA